MRDVHYRGQTLRVTGRERTLVNGFRQPRFVGGLDDLVESVGGFGTLASGGTGPVSADGKRWKLTPAMAAPSGWGCFLLRPL